jgi:uncharacterized membrane protein
MSIAHAVPTMERGLSRWLLLGSLALNLFFVGIAIAMAVRAPAPSYWDRNVFVRVERLAATLPPADADILRGEINANRAAIADAQTAYHTAQDHIRNVLRQEPFDVEALRAAMAKRARHGRPPTRPFRHFRRHRSKISPLAGRAAIGPQRKPVSDKRE